MMMNRDYFKRLKYKKENIPTKPFNKMTFNLSGSKGYRLLKIGEYLETQDDETIEEMFDFKRSFREKNCGLGDNYVDEVKEKRNSGYYLKFDEDYSSDENVLIRFDMDADNDVLYDQNYIEVPDNVKASVVMYYDSDETSCFRNGLLKIKLGTESGLRLVKIQNLSNTSKNFETTKVITKYKSRFESYPVEFGGNLVATTCSTYMPEEWGDIEIYPLYFTDGDMRIDLEQNLIVNGRNSLGIINATGCMKDTSFKIFRGNVFLNRGCKRSIGRFANSDILLNSGVRAQSIPTILCDEDDVMGEHAATFEAINRYKLYYLMSRGFDEMQAKKLIVESSFKPVFNMIEDEDIREKLIAQLDSKL